MTTSGGGLARLAKLPLLQRLSSSGKPPLRLVGVARDHVTGSKRRGEQLLAGSMLCGGQAVELAGLDWGAVDPATPLGAELHGFGWLRDLAAAATRERGAPLAEDLAGRWLLAHGARVDAAWAPALWGERLLFWLAYAPYLLSRRDAEYRSALLNTMARASRHLAGAADEAPPGLPRITAWAGLTAACLLLSSGTARLARAEGGLSRALASAQYDDGGLMSRSPAEQAALVDRLGLLRAAYAAARHDFPQGHPVCLAGRQRGQPRLPGGPCRRLRLSRPAAAHAARLGLSPAERAGHDPGDRRRAAADPQACAHGLCFHPRA